jgi:hypothetical protein
VPERALDHRALNRDLGDVPSLDLVQEARAKGIDPRAMPDGLSSATDSKLTPSSTSEDKQATTDRRSTAFGIRHSPAVERGGHSPSALVAGRLWLLRRCDGGVSSRSSSCKRMTKSRADRRCDLKGWLGPETTCDRDPVPISRSER